MLTNTVEIAGNRTYPRSVMLLIMVCFFLSGLAGLVYEVVWARQLSLFLGITSYAHTAVITAYMAGLAAGSLYFGRYADRAQQPLKIYAWLEIGVGIYAALTPWLFNLLQVVYVSVADVSQIGLMSGHLSRFSIALLALLIPTFLMGGTLPLLVRGFVNELPQLGRATSQLYGINTLGAVCGTLLAGYLLLPRLGVTATIFVGVIINLGIAVLVLVLLRRPQAMSVQPGDFSDGLETEQTPSSETVPGGVLLAGFAVAGFAALLTQVAWIRALILVIGGSVYAFTITLSSFLAGIGLGSLFYTRFLARPTGWMAGSRLNNRLAQAALLAMLTGLTLLPGLALIGKLPGWFLAGYATGLHENFSLFQLFIFCLSFSVMILPTFFMGILFPLVTVIWTRNEARAGQGVGVAYAINTTGTILGALLGGLLILPAIGAHYSVMLAAALYCLVALAFWLISGAGGRTVQQLSVAGVAILLFVSVASLIPPWNKALMVSGVFYNSAQFVRQMTDNDLQRIIEKDQLLYYEEGLDGVVAVRRRRDNNALVINGKTDASSKLDLPTQIMLGQLPLAMNPNAESALIIGLGSGITAGTLTTSEALEKLTILEISREVVEASAFFKTENLAVLEDPRTELVTADARNYLMASPARYDLIISEPSNPWISGISNLFTDEFFQLAKARLNPGGVMTQWFHTYSMSNEDLKTVLKTFDQNFRYVSVWSPVFEDMVIIGSDQPHAISLAKGAMSPARANELRRGEIGSNRDLVRSYLFGNDLLSRYVGDAPINSDNKPVIEFNAPRNLYAHTTQANMTSVFEYLRGQPVPAPVVDLVHNDGDSMDAYFMNLRILKPDGDNTTGSRSSWLVSQLLLGHKTRRTYGYTGSERTLDWSEGQSRFSIRAKQDLSGSPDASATEEPATTGSLEEMRNLSAGTTDKGEIQSGEIGLNDGIKAVWLMREDDQNSKLLMDMSWDCPVESSGFTRYRLSASLPDPGRDDWPEVLDNIAGRIYCN